MKTKLRSLIEATSSKPVIVEIDAIAQSVRARHEASVLAILGYGSCLRGEHVEDTLVDLYVVVESYKSAHKSLTAQLANHLLPPNVYYQECSFNHQIIRCKYAVITLDQFHEKVAPNTDNPYFWARFCQPTAVIYARDDRTRNSVIEALMQAATTSLAHAARLAPGTPAHVQWTELLSHTYNTELRPERANRAAQIINSNLAYFEALHQAIPAASTKLRPAPALNSSWLRRRLVGKALSILRLIKAAFTFDGGADYLAWKITRHSGIEITLSAWQRRHPILAAPKMLWQLYAKGAFK